MIRILRHIRLTAWQKFCMEEWLLLFAAFAVIGLFAIALLACMNSDTCADWLFRLNRVSP